MAICPKCSRDMKPKGNQWVCSCGYSYNMAKKMLTYDELLVILGKQRMRIIMLERFLKDFINSDHEEGTFMRWAKKLMQDRL